MFVNPSAIQKAAKRKVKKKKNYNELKASAPSKRLSGGGWFGSIHKDSNTRYWRNKAQLEKRDKPAGKKLLKVKNKKQPVKMPMIDRTKTHKYRSTYLKQGTKT